MKIAGFAGMALGLAMILFSFFLSGMTDLPAANLQDQIEHIEKERLLSLVQLLGCLLFVVGSSFACTGYILNSIRAGRGG